MAQIATSELIDRFCDELASVIGALLEKPAASSPGELAPGAGYLVTLGATGAGQGTLSVYLESEGAEALTQLMLAADEAPSETAVIESVKDVCGQAAASVVEHGRLPDVRLTVDDVQNVTEVPSDSASSNQIVVGSDELTVRVALWGTLEIVDAPPSAGPLRPGADSPALDVILDMDLPLAVRFGQAELPMKRLVALAPGSVIDLGRSPDEPVDILVSNRVIARGEVVVVAGYFGVRITDVVNPAARVRAMEFDA